MNNDNDKSKGWLQGEIKKRKTQEIDAQLLKRKTQSVTPLSSSTDVKRQTGDIKRTTGSGSAVQSPPSDIRRSTRELSPVSSDARRSTREMSARPLESAPQRSAPSTSFSD